jgi:diguanylate cyclase (GGDEF)-like protein
MGSSDRRDRPSKAAATVKATDAVASEARRRARSAYCPVLVVLSGNEAGRRHVLDRSLGLGRDPDGDVVLTDALVSYHHARMEDRGDGWALVDLGSTNGTLVNGERITESIVRPGDRLVVGNTMLGIELQDHEYGALVERLLNVDDLSGLFVRRKFDADLSIQLESARQRGGAIGLLVMDLDGIKKINDSHGHLFGAYVIGESGKVIGRTLGRRGFAARFGGDEFVAALPGMNLDAAFEVGEAIRESIAAHPFEREGIALRPGISIGVGAFPESAADLESLFNAADQALYRAKEAGKNRVMR